MTKMSNKKIIKRIIEDATNKFSFKSWMSERKLKHNNIGTDWTIVNGSLRNNLLRHTTSTVFDSFKENNKYKDIEQGDMSEVQIDKLTMYVSYFINNYLSGWYNEYLRNEKYKQVEQELEGLSFLEFQSLRQREIESSDAILGEWMTEKMSCFIHAKSGVGKTWFALSCAVAIAGEGQFSKWKCNKARKILYIDGEMSLYDLKQNAIFLAKTMECDKKLVDENLVFLSKNMQDLSSNFIEMDNEGHRVYLEELVKKEGYGVIIFDNVRTLSRMASENDASSWIEINNLVASLKRLCSVMVVHHDRKGGVGSETYSGSTNAVTVFESMVGLTEANKAQNEMEDVGACFNVSFGKYRGLRTEDTLNTVFGLHSEDGWRFKDDDGDLMEQLLGHLQSGNFSSQKAIAEKMGISSSKASRLRKKMIGSGQLTNEQWKAYLSSKELLEDN